MSWRGKDEDASSTPLPKAFTAAQEHRRSDPALAAARDPISAEAARLRLALAAGNLADWSWDARTNLFDFGPRAYAIYQFPPGKRIDWAGLEEGIHPDDLGPLNRLLEQKMAEGGEYEVEYRYRRPNGEEIWVLVSGRTTYAEDGSIAGMVGVLQDVTERRRTEERLRDQARDLQRLYEASQKAAEIEQRARQDAERLSALKDEFLATLSHELRTPLSAILGWVQVLRRRPPAPDQIAHALETVERNARLQAKLIDDLLDVSRIIAGSVRLEAQAVEPISFVKAAVETMRPAADAKGILLECVLDPQGTKLFGDPRRLQQVVWNLISNAIKFTERGGSVTVRLERVGAHLEICVADTGIGIDAEILPHVFDRFRQADGTTSRRYGGLGIGLSIVKHLVELHGGTVHVRSPGANRGSTFTVRLPAESTPETARVEQHQPLPPPRAASSDYLTTDLSGLRVLVTDDEHDSRELVGRVLNDCGAEVVVAASGAEALQAASASSFDVLVSDVGMPEMDGHELVRRLRGLPGEKGSMPAVALTAYAGTEDRLRALRAGFSVHVAKPVETSELVAAVASVAGRTADRSTATTSE